MATTRLVDVFMPEVYGTYGSIPNPTLLAFLNAGVLRADPLLNELADAPSRLITVPYWNDLDVGSEPNATTDNPDDIAVPQKISGGEWVARKAELNNGWSTMDLTRELAAADPMAAIRERTGRYWDVQKQRRLLAICMGVMRSSIANNSGDMVIDRISADASPDETNMFDADAAVDAAFTFGDRSETLKALAVHSVVYKNMVKADLIEQMPVSDGSTTVPSYLGRPVIVDDILPVEVVNGANVYTSIFFAPGAIGFGEGTPTTPTEVEREASRGNGGGMETLWERKTWLMHPAGYHWNETGSTGNAMATGQPMEANLSNANRWTRVEGLSRKMIPLAFVRTNG